MLVRREISELSETDLVEIIGTIDYEDIPAEFIQGVRMQGTDGIQRYYTGDEWKNFLNDPTTMAHGPFELALDLDRLSKDVNAITRKILGKNVEDKSNTSS